jgi:DNA-binding beta-propeller fold protein YncE
VDPKRNLVYVANTHGDNITAIDGAHHHILKTLPAPKNPYALAVNPHTGQLFVASLAAPALTVLDTR